MIWPIFSWTSLVNLSLLFILTVLGSLGIPGTLVWILSSGALATNFSDLLLLIIIVALAAIIGDLIAYELARKFSSALFSKLSKFKSFKKGEQKTRALLKKSEFLIVFLSRFILIAIGAIVSYISGFERIDRRKYITAVVIGESLYASIYTIMGFMFKETWLELTNVVCDITWVLVFIVIIGVIIKIFYDNKLKRQQTK